MICELANGMSDFDEYQINWNVGLIMCHTKANGSLEGVVIKQSVILELYETKSSNFF